MMKYLISSSKLLFHLTIRIWPTGIGSPLKICADTILGVLLLTAPWLMCTICAHLKIPEAG